VPEGCQHRGLVADPLEVLGGIVHGHLDGNIRPALKVGGPENLRQGAAAQEVLELVAACHDGSADGGSGRQVPAPRGRGAHAERAAEYGSAASAWEARAYGERIQASSWNPQPQRHTGGSWTGAPSSGSKE
jgi:hypothetical protein